MAKTPFSSTYPNLARTNLWINGAFDYWQRNTTFSTPANGAYNADRMAHFYDGSGSAFTISRQAFTLGQTDVPGKPKWFHRIQVTTAGTGGTVRYHRQAIEGVEDLSGKTITISFYAKADATRSIYLQAAQVFGTGGSPSSSVNTTGSAFNITTSWAKYKVTLTLPSVAGKTLGTNGNDYTDIQFQLPVNTLMTIDLAMIMINEGSDAADFSRAGGDLTGELILCQRYYEKSYNADVAPGSNSIPGMVGGLGDATGRLTPGLVFKVRKRAAPVCSIYSQGGTVGQVTVLGGANNGGGFCVADNPSTIGSIFVNATVTAGTVYYYHWTADAEL